MRLAVIGSSGSGKSTFARRLAERLDAPHVELDALNWDPGWRDLSRGDPDELRRRADAALPPDGAWVTDGNYRVVRPLTFARATDLVWLDYDRPVIMGRVLRRSFVRAVTRQELWAGTGNREEFRRWLSRDHPIRWAWDTFARRRAEYEVVFADPALGHLARHRLRRPCEAVALIHRLTEEPVQVEQELGDPSGIPVRPASP